MIYVIYCVIHFKLKRAVYTLYLESGGKKIKQFLIKPLIHKELMGDLPIRYWVIRNMTIYLV